MPNSGIQLSCIGTWAHGWLLGLHLSQLLGYCLASSCGTASGAVFRSSCLELDGFPDLNCSAGHHFHPSSL